MLNETDSNARELTSKTSAIILAAGLSQRMGAVNKLLIPINGKAMVRHVVEQYSKADIEQIIVVVGHQQERVRAALAGLDVNIVFNDDFNNGQITSIRCGLNVLSEQARAQNNHEQANTVLIGLSDQPLLTSDDIKTLLQAFAQQSEKTMLVPHYQNAQGQSERGNPIVLCAKQALAVDEDGISLGCRKLIHKYPDKVLRFEVTTNHYNCDLDTALEVTELLGSQAIAEVELA